MLPILFPIDERGPRRPPVGRVRLVPGAECACLQVQLPSGGWAYYSRCTAHLEARARRRAAEDVEVF